jgi:hypothetical protein
MGSVNRNRTRHAEQRAAFADVVGRSYVPVGYAQAEPAYQQLFDGYVLALGAAKAEAELCWQRLIDTELARSGDPEEALAEVRARKPNGAVIHGAVIHAVRSGWLGCDALNQSVAPPSRVEPFELVFDWLLDERHPELLEFLGGFPFLPIALDAQGRWI